METQASSVDNRKRAHWPAKRRPAVAGPRFQISRGGGLRACMPFCSAPRLDTRLGTVKSRLANFAGTSATFRHFARQDRNPPYQEHRRHVQTQAASIHSCRAAIFCQPASRRSHRKVARAWSFTRCPRPASRDASARTRRTHSPRGP